MDDTLPTNPYKAGFGLAPPRFAGRRMEIRIIVKALEEIKGKAGKMERSPDPMLALVGPRGVGKTVLLQRAIDEAQLRDIHVGEVSRKILSGPQDNKVSQLFPVGVVKEILERLKDIGGTNVSSGVSLGLYETQKILRLTMLEYLSKKPMLLILDEAHHCEPEGLNMLFDIVQVCLRGKLPLAVIIAGTPGLVKHLRRCEMTFVERSKFLHFNTLSNEDAKEALEIPARETGRPIDEGALQSMLDWSDNYPYFIQMAGEHAWNASESRGGREISPDDAKAGLAEADLLRNDFYEERYEEIYDLKVDDSRIVDQAVQVAELVTRRENSLDRGKLATRLTEINDGMDEDRAIGIVDALLEKGYVWRKHGVILPGIPSLFDFVKQKRANT